MKLNVVPPSTGIEWVKMGVRTFFRQPMALAGLFFMYMALGLVVSQLPVIGVVIGGMLVPAATLGLMAASAEANRGRFPAPSILISGFRVGRQRARAMMVLGAIYTTGSVVATGLATLIAGDMQPMRPGELDGATLLALVLHLPLLLAFWHAPALVHWHGVSPAKALFFSLVAVKRNLGAHVVFTLASGALMTGVLSVLGLLGGLLGGATLVQALMAPATLLLGAMIFCSLYFTFRDNFGVDEPTLEGQTTP